MDWTTILTSFGIAAIAFPSLAWLIKSLTLHQLSKDAEFYKAELHKAAVEHQVRFSKLHEKQAEIIAELYRLLVVAKNTGRYLRGQPETFTEDNREIAKLVLGQATQAYLYYKEHELYFSRETSETIETCHFSIAKDVLLYDGMAKILKETGSGVPPHRMKMLEEVIIRGWKDWDNGIDKVLDDLRESFRSMLGVK